LLKRLLDQRFKLYKNEFPFEHWILTDFLNTQMLEEIHGKSQEVVFTACKLKRSEHNNRLFLTNGHIAELFNSNEVKDFFSNIVNVDLHLARTRLELCVDMPGFSLEPHIDIPEKLLTLQLYISGEMHCGTDLYPIRVPFITNTGWLIKNNPNTLHGFEKRHFTKNRVSLILNYVNSNWWDVDQLFNGSNNE
jgi:hypothetical protein